MLKHPSDKVASAPQINKPSSSSNVGKFESEPRKNKQIPDGRQQSYFASMSSGVEDEDPPVNFKKWGIALGFVAIVCILGLAGLFMV